MVHINPKYVSLALQGGHRITHVISAEIDTKKPHAFMAYNIHTDRMMYLVLNTSHVSNHQHGCCSVWEMPEGVKSIDIASVEWIEDNGGKCMDDVWMLRNEEQSPFCFERK